jgi:hypothetical protein
MLNYIFEQFFLGFKYHFKYKIKIDISKKIVERYVRWED